MRNSDRNISEASRKKLLLYIFGLVTLPYLLFAYIFVITLTKKAMVETTSSMPFSYQLILLFLAILVIVVRIVLENLLKIIDLFGLDFFKTLIVLSLFNGARVLEFTYSYLCSISLGLTQLLILLPLVFSIIYLIKWSKTIQHVQ